MLIIYRDLLGTIAVQIDMQYGISFFEGYAYFSDKSGRDYKIPMSDLAEIQKY